MTLEAVSGVDWNCFQGTTGPGGSAFATLASGTPAGCTVTYGATQTWADGGTTGVGTNETKFKGGTKFDDVCPVVIGGNTPNKDEWTNIAEYTEAATATNSDGGHDLFFYGASIRPIVNGNSSGNIYFSQATNGCHTVGAVLLTLPGAVVLPGSPPRIRLADPLTAYRAREAGHVHDWWADDPRQRFWLEITDRRDIGVDLHCPQRDADGNRTPGYSLIWWVERGDILLIQTGCTSYSRICLPMRSSTPLRRRLLR